MYRKPLGYGWFRTGLPQTLDGLTALPTASLWRRSTPRSPIASSRRPSPSSCRRFRTRSTMAKAPDRRVVASAPPPPPREASVGCPKNSDTLPSNVALAPIVTLTLSPKTGTVNHASAKSPDSGPPFVYEARKVRRQDRVGAEIDLLDGERLVGGHVLGHLEVADEVGVAVLVLNEIVTEFGGRKLGKSARS